MMGRLANEPMEFKETDMLEERMLAVEAAIRDINKYLLPLTEVVDMKKKESEERAAHAEAARKVLAENTALQEGYRRAELEAAVKAEGEGTAGHAAAVARLEAFDEGVKTRLEAQATAEKVANGAGAPGAAKPVAAAWPSEPAKPVAAKPVPPFPFRAGVATPAGEDPALYKQPVP